MSTIKDSGDRTQFGSGAICTKARAASICCPCASFFAWPATTRPAVLSTATETGRRVYPATASPIRPLRHLVKYMDGHTDEDHLIAAIWNLCGLAWTEEKRPDLMDIPARLEEVV